MATCYGGVKDTSMENPETQDLDNVSQDDFQDENIVQRLLCKTECLKQAIEDRDNDPREAIHQLEQRLNRLTLTPHQLYRNLEKESTKLYAPWQKETSWESSLLQNIPIQMKADCCQAASLRTGSQTLRQSQN